MTKEELENEINQYIINLKIAIDAFQMEKDIKELSKIYLTEINTMSNFVQMTLVSLQITYIMETVKLLDKNSDRNLEKVLNQCEQNSKLFPEKFKCKIEFSGRLLKEDYYTREVNIIEDIEKCRNNLISYNDTIQKLKGMRDKYFAHSDKKYFGNSEKLFKVYNIKEKEFKELQEFILDCLNTLLLDLSNTSQFIRSTSYKEELEKTLKKIKRH